MWVHDCTWHVLFPHRFVQGSQEATSSSIQATHNTPTSEEIECTGWWYMHSRWHTHAVLLPKTSTSNSTTHAMHNPTTSSRQAGRDTPSRVCTCDGCSSTSSSAPGGPRCAVYYGWAGKGPLASESCCGPRGPGACRTQGDSCTVLMFVLLVGAIHDTHTHQQHTFHAQVLSISDRYHIMRNTAHTRLAFGRSGIHGYGLFTRTAHSAGTLLIEYAGYVCIIIKVVCKIVCKAYEYSMCVWCIYSTCVCILFAQGSGAPASGGAS